MQLVVEPFLAGHAFLGPLGLLDPFMAIIAAIIVAAAAINAATIVALTTVMRSSNLFYST
jgi:hypothetical protein